MTATSTATSYWLRFRLISDATFGRGDGVAGVVDAEVQHDEYGLPYLGGRALKGLLGEECANLMYALQHMGQDQPWRDSAQRLFGRPGSGTSEGAWLHIGPARLPADLRRAITAGIEREEMTREQVLHALTAIRRQTAVDPKSGAPLDETLRSMRVVLRDTLFEATLDFAQPPIVRDLYFLAACVAAWRRAGTGRNRGRGELKAWLCDSQDQDRTGDWLQEFVTEVRA